MSSPSGRKTIFLDYDTDKPTGGAIVYDENFNEIERFQFDVINVDKSIVFLVDYGKPVGNGVPNPVPLYFNKRIIRIFPIQSIAEVTTRKPKPSNG